MTDIITLKQLCTELKLDRREARELLRTAARDTKRYPGLAKQHKPRRPWSWAKSSDEEKEARKALMASKPLNLNSADQLQLQKKKDKRRPTA